MKCIFRKSQYGMNIYIVELKDDEVGLPDAILISMADGVSKEKAIGYYANNKHPSHFGGTIERLLNNKARITVYID